MRAVEGAIQAVTAALRSELSGRDHGRRPGWVQEMKQGGGRTKRASTSAFDISGARCGRPPRGDHLVDAIRGMQAKHMTRGR
eukprot:635531-Lingulodinium_polyedra.AAC.1